MSLGDTQENVVKETLASVEDGLRKRYPEALEEMGGIAEGAGLNYEDVLLLNFTSEIKSRVHQGCTSFAAVGGASRTSNPIMGKTRDMSSQAYFPFQIAVNVRSPEKFKVFLAEAFSGMAVTGCGMNEHGLALALSIIISIEDADSTVGVQRAFFARLILEECRSVKDALKIFSKTDLAYQGANFLICDPSGDCALIEKSHQHQSVIRPNEGVIASTNHFTDTRMLQFGKTVGPSSKARLERIDQLLESNRGNIDLAETKAFLRDHAHGLSSNSICRHTLTNGNTVQAYVLDPCRRRVFIADGHPCTSRFQQYLPF